IGWGRAASRSLFRTAYPREQGADGQARRRQDDESYGFRIHRPNVDAQSNRPDAGKTPTDWKLDSLDMTYRCATVTASCTVNFPTKARNLQGHTFSALPTG